MRMSPTTRMMVMSDRYSRSNGSGGDNTDRSGGRATPRTNTAQGHTYSRTSDMVRDNTRYGRERNASRSYGYDPDTEVNMRGPQRQYREGEEDDWDDEGEEQEPQRRQRHQKQKKPQRMYAAGMAWAEDDDDEEDEHGEMTEEKALKCVKKMKTADGSPSPHYQPEQAEQLRKNHCPECEKWEWFVALNMMYADYVDVAKKMSMNKDDFYLHMAKAFLMDEDAGPHKLEKYLKHIPKK